MRVRAQAVWVGGFALLVALSASACGQIAGLQARKAWKEGNAFYRQQDYQRAADRYEEVLQADPEGRSQNPPHSVHFFLGNSYDNLYRPGRKGEASNDELLTKAIANYQRAAEKIQDAKMKDLSLRYLVAAYGPEKLNDPSQAEPVLLKMIEADPSDPANYFYLGRLYEDAGSYDQAEAMYLKAKDVRPNDSTVYMQLAGYYNRQGEFDKSMEAFEQRVTKEPGNPEAHYTVATHYWDKVFRDFRLRENEKKEYIGKGLQAVDTAIKIKPDYIDALAYRGLLLREEAKLEKNAERQKALIREAEQLQSRAAELKKKQVAGVGS